MEKGGGTVLDRVVREDLFVRMAFEQRPKWSEGINWVFQSKKESTKALKQNVWGHSVPLLFLISSPPASLPHQRFPLHLYSYFYYLDYTLTSPSFTCPPQSLPHCPTSMFSSLPTHSHDSVSFFPSPPGAWGMPCGPHCQTYTGS